MDARLPKQQASRVEQALAKCRVLLLLPTGHQEALFRFSVRRGSHIGTRYGEKNTPRSRATCETPGWRGAAACASSSSSAKPLSKGEQVKPIASLGETTSDSALAVASLIDEGSSEGREAAWRSMFGAWALGGGKGESLQLWWYLAFIYVARSQQRPRDRHCGRF